MLSKKMAVSLTSLITILALAFVGSSAMADFALTLDARNDVSSIGKYELMNPHYFQPPSNVLWVRVLSDQAIDLAAVKDTDITISGFDEDSNYIPSVGFVTNSDNYPDGGVTPTTASKSFWLHIMVTPETAKIKLKIAAGIAAADVFNEETSGELNKEIFLVMGDMGPPSVYSIVRTDNPLLKVKADTLHIIVTLSERAKKFDKDFISATNADVTAVTMLDPVPEVTAGTVLRRAEITGSLQGLSPPVLRGLLDSKDRNGRSYSAGAGIETDDGIHTALLKSEKALALTQEEDGKVQAVDADADTSLRQAARLFNLALLEANDATINADGTGNETGVTRFGTTEVSASAYGTANLNKNDGSTPTGGTAIEIALTTNIPHLVAHDIDDLHKALSGTITEVTVTIDSTATPVNRVTFSGIDRPDFPGTAPNASDFQSLAVYEAHRDLWNAQRRAKDVYEAGVALKVVYDEFVRDAMAADDEALADYLTLTLTDEDRQLIQHGTGRTAELQPYAVELTPKYPAGKPDIVVKVKSFEDEDDPPKKYTPPQTPDGYYEGRDKLTIKVDREDLIAGVAGTKVTLAKEHFIPKDGYLVVVDDADGSAVINPGGAKDAPPVTRTPAGLKYNLHTAQTLPNLEGFLLNGGTIDVVSPLDLRITEVMWGTDASLTDDNSRSQWIELINLGAGANTVDEDANTTAIEGTHLIFYGPGETLPAVSTVKDRIGGLTPADLVDRGQNGRTGVGEEKADLTARVPTQALISMSRVMNADGTYADGTLAASWVASGDAATGLGVNFNPNVVGRRIGTPGADDIKRPTPPPPPTPTPTVPAAKGDEIMITEIMVDTSEDRFPQWIELTYSGTSKATLNGWNMTIDNAIDPDVVGKGNALTVSLDGVTLDVSKDDRNLGDGQSVLVVAWASARHSPKIRDNGVLNIGTQIYDDGRRYQLLSYNGFRITLVPPKAGVIAADGDIVGNLHEDWELPMLEGPKRSSLIRREMAKAGTAILGTEANGWRLASATQLISGPETFYGNDEDAGTPGYDAGGPLPVELSHFRPARDKATGAVVITWATQSELNNAGFFIKRSNQRNGQFTVINPTMVPGAGTTSEKQFYTYTDTTAQPNVVYYYQIEDVSLDGNRQLLTRGIRLKGHVGAAGKATTLWGELKTSHE